MKLFNAAILLGLATAATAKTDLQEEPWEFDNPTNNCSGAKDPLRISQISVHNAKYVQTSFTSNTQVKVVLRSLAESLEAIRKMKPPVKK